MSLWRIQISIPNDPRSLERFTDALAERPVSLVRLAARDINGDTGAAEMTGEAVVDLAHDDGLAAMLGALHGISPRVFVSRAEPEESPVPGAGHGRGPAR
jgi:hypothetical protein